MHWQLRPQNAKAVEGCKHERLNERADEHQHYRVGGERLQRHQVPWPELPHARRFHNRLAQRGARPRSSRINAPNAPTVALAAHELIRTLLVGARAPVRVKVVGRHRKARIRPRLCKALDLVSEDQRLAATVQHEPTCKRGSHLRVMLPRAAPSISRVAIGKITKPFAAPVSPLQRDERRQVRASHVQVNRFSDAVAVEGRLDALVTYRIEYWDPHAWLFDDESEGMRRSITIDEAHNAPKHAPIERFCVAA